MSSPPAPAGGDHPDTLDPGARRRWSAERRAAARRHHPDRGGSTEALLEAYAQVDARFGLAPPGRGRPFTSVPGTRVEVLAPPWWRRLARHLADGADRVRRPSTRFIDVTAPPPRESAPRHGGRPS